MQLAWAVVAVVALAVALYLLAAAVWRGRL